MTMYDSKNLNSSYEKLKSKLAKVKEELQWEYARMTALGCLTSLSALGAIGAAITDQTESFYCATICTFLGTSVLLVANDVPELKKKIKRAEKNLEAKLESS